MIFGLTYKLSNIDCNIFVIVYIFCHPAHHCDQMLQSAMMLEDFKVS